MDIDYVASIIAGLASLLAPLVLSIPLFRSFGRRVLRKPDGKEPSYAERLSELSASLTKASKEVDGLLAELAHVARDREEAVVRLESDLETLQDREQELKLKIEALENTPLPVAEHFAKLLESDQKRSAMRDYVLFCAGVGLTTLITVLIQLLG